MEAKTFLQDDGNYTGSSSKVHAAGAPTSSVSFPDPLTPFEQKLDPSFGRAIAKLIANDWFGNDGRISAGCGMMNRRDYVRQKRLFVRGEHDLGYFKDSWKKGDNDLDFINIDWSNINWAEKFCRIVSNGISDKNYKLDIRSNNRLAAVQKEEKRDHYLKYIASKPLLEKALKTTGIDLMPKGYMPEDEQELEMFMQIKERTRIEIAEELMINYVFNTNRWDFISEQYNKDLVDVGLIVCRIYLDKNDGVKFDYVDPENYVHSRVTSNDFHDKYYEGVVKTVTLSDIRRLTGWDDDTLKAVAKSHGTNKVLDWDTCKMSDLIDIQIQVLDFAYKTSKTITYKRKARNGVTTKLSKRNDTYKAPEHAMVSKTLDTWLEGSHIIGTDYLFGYKECENLWDDIMNKSHSPFTTIAYDFYENELRSFTGNIEAPARQLQKISLKIQQLVNELKPDLIEVDLDMLAELDMGKGGAKGNIWQNALTMMEVKGVVFSQRVQMGDLGIKDKSAVNHVGVQQGSALAPLLNVWAQYYNMIRENTGVNPARDGSAPNDTLVGLNQMAQLASNTVTKNIVDAAVLFKKRISEVVSTRLHSIFTYKDAGNIRKIYENAVGKQMWDGLEVLKDRSLHEFGFTLENIATQEQVQEFKEDLAIAIQSGAIDVQIKAEATMLATSNIKLASEYVAYHIRKNTKEKQEWAIQESQAKSQNDIAAAQAAEQAKVQSYQAQKQIDITYAQELAKIEIFKAQALQQINQPVAEKEFQEEVFLTKLKTQVDMGQKAYMEDRKDLRTEKQATQQSKLKKQAESGGAPIDFEAEGNWYL